MNSIKLQATMIMVCIVLAYVCFANIIDYIISTEITINENNFGKCIGDCAGVRKYYKDDNNFFKIGIPFTRLPKLGTVFVMCSLLLMENLASSVVLFSFLHNHPYILCTTILPFGWICIYIILMCQRDKIN